MKCPYHPKNEIIASCINCGKFVCTECKNEIKGKIYCNNCLDKMIKNNNLSISSRDSIKRRNPKNVSLVNKNLIIALALTALAVIILSFYLLTQGLIDQNMIVGIFIVVVLSLFFAISLLDRQHK